MTQKRSGNSSDSDSQEENPYSTLTIQPGIQHPGTLQYQTLLFDSQRNQTDPEQLEYHHDSGLIIRITRTAAREILGVLPSYSEDISNITRDQLVPISEANLFNLRHWRIPPELVASYLAYKRIVKSTRSRTFEIRKGVYEERFLARNPNGRATVPLSYEPKAKLRGWFGVPSGYETSDEDEDYPEEEEDDSNSGDSSLFEAHSNKRGAKSQSAASAPPLKSAKTSQQKTSSSSSSAGGSKFGDTSPKKAAPRKSKAVSSSSAGNQSSSSGLFNHGSTQPASSAPAELRHVWYGEYAHGTQRSTETPCRNQRANEYYFEVLQEDESRWHITVDNQSVYDFRHGCRVFSRPREGWTLERVLRLQLNLPPLPEPSAGHGHAFALQRKREQATKAAHSQETYYDRVESFILGGPLSSSSSSSSSSSAVVPQHQRATESSSSSSVVSAIVQQTNSLSLGQSSAPVATAASDRPAPTQAPPPAPQIPVLHSKVRYRALTREQQAASQAREWASACADLGPDGWKLRRAESGNWIPVYRGEYENALRARYDIRPIDYRTRRYFETEHVFPDPNPPHPAFLQEWNYRTGRRFSEERDRRQLVAAPAVAAVPVNPPEPEQEEQEDLGPLDPADDPRQQAFWDNNHDPGDEVSGDDQSVGQQAPVVVRQRAALARNQEPDGEGDSEGEPDGDGDRDSDTESELSDISIEAFRDELDPAIENLRNHYSGTPGDFADKYQGAEVPRRTCKGGPDCPRLLISPRRNRRQQFYCVACTTKNRIYYLCLYCQTQHLLTLCRDAAERAREEEKRNKREGR